MRRSLMRPNPVRQRLAEGETCIGTMAFEFFTPGLTQILGNAGADFVILDMEHSGIGIDTIKSQSAFARGTGVSPCVRVPALTYPAIASVLDAGAQGVMVPMLETPEQAAQLGAWCRYRPEGTRGLAFSIAHDDYRSGDIVAKMRAANARTLAIALIETPDGVENADAIAAVPGIDVVWLGHYDLTNAMNISGQFDHPRFQAAWRSLIAACRRHRKAAGILVADVASGRRWLKRGFRAICFGTDVSIFAAAMQAGISGLAGREKMRKNSA